MMRSRRLEKILANRIQKIPLFLKLIHGRTKLMEASYSLSYKIPLHAIRLFRIGAEVALPLWVLGTYVFNLFRIFPMIGLVSPEKRCGKSTVLTLLKALCCKSILASNISTAAIYRVIEAWQPTLLIDEADTFLKDNDEMRGIINSGHTKDTAYVIRTEGDNYEPKKFSTWAPKAIAMIGDMPDTK